MEFNDKFFCKNEINLTNIKDKNKFLKLLTKALYSLSHSKVYSGKLGVGGECHKNYYSIIKQTFSKDKSEIFLAKNVKINEFGEVIKLNMCNYGIYFYKKNDVDYIKVFCGNGFILHKTQQNYIEKFVRENN